MILEIITLGIFVYLLFGKLIKAKIEELHQRARRMELENDHLEFGDHQTHDDELEKDEE